MSPTAGTAVVVPSLIWTIWSATIVSSPGPLPVILRKPGPSLATSEANPRCQVPPPADWTVTELGRFWRRSGRTCTTVGSADSAVETEPMTAASVMTATARYACLRVTRVPIAGQLIFPERSCQGALRQKENGAAEAAPPPLCDLSLGS